MEIANCKMKIPGGRRDAGTGCCLDRRLWGRYCQCEENAPTDVGGYVMVVGARRDGDYAFVPPMMLIGDGVGLRRRWGMN